MFGGKNKENSNAKSNIIPSATAHALNSLVQGTTVTGDIQAETDIRIDGKLEGTLRCKAKVIIGPSGSVNGEIHCQNAVVEGKFEGTLTVVQLLNVREKARVSGKITTGKIIVQAGAEFNVTCEMAQGNPSGNAATGKGKPQKEIAKETA